MYIPFGEGYTADLIAEFNGKLNRIQIKTTEKLHNDHMLFRITRQDGFHGSKKKYTEDEIDYFSLYCVETDILCLVPISEAKTESLTIRLDSYEGIRSKVMKFVSQYKFENFVKE